MNDNYFPPTKKEAEKAGIPFSREDNREYEFPKRLKEARNHANILQDTAADKIGITRSTIGLYENGMNVPDVRTLVDIVKTYNVTANYLLGIDERPTYENEFIGKETGLSDTSIDILKSIKDEEDSAWIYQTLDCLLSNLKKNKSLHAIWEYLFSDKMKMGKGLTFVGKDKETNTEVSMPIDNEIMKKIELYNIQLQISKLREILISKEKNNGTEKEPEGDGEYPST